MKKALFISTILILHFYKITAQSSFIKSYSDTNSFSYGVFLNHGCIQDNGDYVQLGLHWQSFFSATRFDSTGNKKWSYRYTGINLESIFSSPASDGGTLITGSARIDYHHTKILITKIDSNGNVNWAKTLKLIHFNTATISISRTTNNGFLISGYYYKQKPKAVIIKIDSIGNVDWTERIKVNNSEAIVQTSIETLNHKYVVVGSYGNPLIALLNKQGKVLKIVISNNFYQGYFMGIVNLADSGFMAFGKFQNQSNSPWLQFICRFNKELDCLWSKQVSNNGCLPSSPLNNLTVMNSGLLYISAYNNSGPVIEAIDTAANKTYYHNFLNPYVCTIDDMVLKNNKIYMLGGSGSTNPSRTFISSTDNLNTNCFNYISVLFLTPLTVTFDTVPAYHYPAALNDSSVIITQSNYDLTFTNECILSSANDDISHYSISIIPNPATDNISIEIPNQKTTAQISVFNIQGQLKLYEEINSPQSAQIGISSLANGIYIIEIICDGKTYFNKFIKQ